MIETKKQGKPLPHNLPAWNSERVLNAFCPSVPLLETISKRLSTKNAADSAVNPESGWVMSADFILTTANTWQRPIEDFTLIVERPRTEKGDETLVSFCSPGPVEKLDVNHFQVHLTNFVPTKELHIGFFDVPEVKPALSKPKK